MLQRRVSMHVTVRPRRLGSVKMRVMAIIVPVGVFMFQCLVDMLMSVALG